MLRSVRGAVFSAEFAAGSSMMSQTATAELTEVIGGVHPERPDIVEGSWVTIKGLKSGAQHNGAAAVVFGYDPEKGYKVHTAAPGLIGKVPTDTVLNIRPENVELDVSQPANPEYVANTC